MKDAEQTCIEAATALQEQQEEIERCKSLVIALGAPHATTMAKLKGLPDGHLLPNHYDALASCGARMDDFTRSPEPSN